jgi:hypothetical protein
MCCSKEEECNHILRYEGTKDMEGCDRINAEMGIMRIVGCRNESNHRK